MIEKRKTIQMLFHGVKDFVFLVAKPKFKEDLFVIGIIVVVSLASFGLGRLSAVTEQGPQIRLVGGEEASVLLSPESDTMRGGTDQGETSQYIASKTGTKYYFPWCVGASHIADANKIYFNSVKEAQDAGYSSASNCKGIK